VEHSAKIIANLKKGQAFQRPYLLCQAKLVSYEALYDKGADISCINKDIFRKIPIMQRSPRSLSTSLDSLQQLELKP
jgi:hypothetical protein